MGNKNNLKKLQQLDQNRLTGIDKATPANLETITSLTDKNVAGSAKQTQTLNHATRGGGEGGVQSKAISLKLTKSYGGMTVTLQFLLPLSQLRLQALSKYFYETGVGRVQTRFVHHKVIYFTDHRKQRVDAADGGPQIIAYWVSSQRIQWLKQSDTGSSS